MAQPNFVLTKVPQIANTDVAGSAGQDYRNQPVPAAAAFNGEDIQQPIGGAAYSVKGFILFDDRIKTTASARRR